MQVIVPTDILVTNNIRGGFTTIQGREFVEVIPSCAIWAITNNYTSKVEKYIPFMESKDCKKRLIEEK